MSPRRDTPLYEKVGPGDYVQTPITLGQFDRLAVDRDRLLVMLADLVPVVGAAPACTELYNGLVRLARDRAAEIAAARTRLPGALSRGQK